MNTTITHTHNLAGITGYVVFHTVANGQVLAERKPVACFLDAADYGKALEIADCYRGPGSFAIVACTYACGCILN